MTDIVFVSRAPRRRRAAGSSAAAAPELLGDGAAGDLFRASLLASGLISAPLAPGDLRRFEADGFAWWEVAVPAPAPDDRLDPHAAQERLAARRAILETERLEREVERIGARVVVFVGRALAIAMLGSRMELAAHEETAPAAAIESPIPFGGGVAIAVPAPAPSVHPSRIVAALRNVASLRRAPRAASPR